MENIIKELKENLLNKDFTLLEIDDKIKNITNSNSSIFDNLDIIENGYCIYIIKHKKICVEFEIIENNTDISEIKIKVENIFNYIEN